MNRARRFGAAGEFLAVVEPLLLAAEAEHGLMLGLASRVKDGGGAVLVAVEDAAGRAVLAGLRTPPRKLVLSEGPDEAVDAIAAFVAHEDPELPGVHAPSRVARRFAERFAALAGRGTRLGMRLRVHRADAVQPVRDPGGTMRWARADERDALVEWSRGFMRDTKAHFEEDPAAIVDRLAAADALFVWEHDDVPRAMAAWQRPTRHGISVSFVYTPPAERGRGFATALVAALTRRLLAEGRRFCALYTDLDNPTSNAIYARIGYRPVCDIEDWWLPKLG